MTMQVNIKRLVGLVLIFSNVSFAHEGHFHALKKAALPPPSKMEVATKMYLAEIKPIFQKKCYDCHSGPTIFPWYYKIPGVKQFIDSDIKDAKKHIDMSSDFPFKGHGSMEGDLKEVLKEIEEHEMPPLIYRVMHRGTAVTDQELVLIKKWIETVQ